MPALQVRDFPDDLYSELKEFAAKNHRSISSQTIIAVERLMATSNAEAAPKPVTSSSNQSEQNRISSPKEISEDRLAKRQEIFDRAKQRRCSLKADIPTPENMLHRARKERTFSQNDLHEQLYEEDVRQ